MTKHLIHALQQSLIIYGMQTCSKSPMWLRAFATYNEDHEISERLSITCRPCYDKVLHYLSKISE